MRPKTKNTLFFTHRQQKIPRTKPQKRKNKQQQNNHCCFFIAFASTIQFSHNTPPHTTPTNQQLGILPTRGDFIEQQPCCSRHPTACHKTKQTKTQTHLLPCKTLMANWPKKPYFVSLIPLHAQQCAQAILHLKIFATSQAPN